MNFNIFFSLILLCCLYSYIYSHAHTNKKFRQDYEYIEATESFYKLHFTTALWLDAKRMCAVEGAQLFYPKDKEELNAVTSYWNKTLKTSRTKYIYIGISNYLIPAMYLTIDGKSVSEVYNKWQSFEPTGSLKRCILLDDMGTYFVRYCDTQNNFICKKTQDNLQWNTRCNMQNLDYIYNETEDKCYKFHNTRMSWTDAFRRCMLEEAYLAIINYGRERNFFMSLIEKSKGHGASSNESVHLGFHNNIGDGWQTIKGEAVETWEFAEWAAGSPDQSAQSDNKCGAMSSMGALIDIPCHTTSYFICEHDIEINSSLNEDSLQTISAL